MMLSPTLLTANLTDAASKSTGVQTKGFREAFWRYNDAWSRYVDPRTELLIQNESFDLGAYARYKCGPTAFAILDTPHVFGWRIKFKTALGWRIVGIDMLDVALWHGTRRFGNRLKNWGCYYLNNGPYAWRGCAIVRKNGLRW